MCIKNYNYLLKYMSHFLSHDCPKSTMREYVHMYQFSLLKSKNQ